MKEPEPFDSAITNKAYKEAAEGSFLITENVEVLNKQHTDQIGNFRRELLACPAEDQNELDKKMQELESVCSKYLLAVVPQEIRQQTDIVRENMLARHEDSLWASENPDFSVENVPEGAAVPLIKEKICERLKGMAKERLEATFTLIEEPRSNLPLLNRSEMKGEATLNRRIAQGYLIAIHSLIEERWSLATGSLQYLDLDLLRWSGMQLTAEILKIENGSIWKLDQLSVGKNR